MVFAIVVTIGFCWLLVALWVGFDAGKYSPHDPLLWTLTVFFGGLAGLFVYFNLGRQPHAAGTGGWRVSEEPDSAGRPQLRDCPNCQARELAAEEECRFCGATLEPPSTDGPWFADR